MTAAELALEIQAAAVQCNEWGPSSSLAIFAKLEKGGILAEAVEQAGTHPLHPHLSPLLHPSNALALLTYFSDKEEEASL